MRIRTPFAAAFLILFALSAFGGLLPNSSLPTTAPPFAQSDKVLHFVTCFALTLTFYFILDTSRRRVLHLTLAVCTIGVGVGSEVAQGLLPNDRTFDPLDVLANVLGSLAALGLATWYHRRSAERRRRARYSVLEGNLQDEEEDLELGEGPGLRARGENELVTDNDTVSAPSKTVEEELDNWDENAEDEAWEEDDDATTGDSAGAKMTPASSSVGDEDLPKKAAVDEPSRKQ